jgi:hypothetical protein
MKDILKAANICRSRCQDSSDAWFQPYVFWFNDQEGYKPRRYCAEDGIVIFFSRIKPVCNYTHLPMFLKNFASQTNCPKTIVAAKVETKNTSIDMQRFMDIIVNTQDSNNRNFLYETYKKLGGLKL